MKSEHTYCIKRSHRKSFNNPPAFNTRMWGKRRAWWDETERKGHFTYRGRVYNYPPKPHQKVMFPYCVYCEKVPPYE